MIDSIGKMYVACADCRATDNIHHCQNQLPYLATGVQHRLALLGFLMLEVVQDLIPVSSTVLA